MSINPVKTMEDTLKDLAEPMPAKFLQLNNFTNKQFFPIGIWKKAMYFRVPHHSVTCHSHLSGIYCVTDVKIEIACVDGILVRSASGFEVFETEKQMRGNPATNSFAQAYKLACVQLGLGKIESDNGEG